MAVDAREQHRPAATDGVQLVRERRPALLDAMILVVARKEQAIGQRAHARKNCVDGAAAVDVVVACQQPRVRQVHVAVVKARHDRRAGAVDHFGVARQTAGPRIEQALDEPVLYDQAPCARVRFVERRDVGVDVHFT